MRPIVYTLRLFIFHGLRCSYAQRFGHVDCFRIGDVLYACKPQRLDIHGPFVLDKLDEDQGFSDDPLGSKQSKHIEYAALGDSATIVPLSIARLNGALRGDSASHYAGTTKV